MGIFDFLGLSGKTEKVNDLLNDGAIIIDVRSQSEYEGGHINNSKNVPLEKIDSYFGEWKKSEQAVVFCCASGIRSGAATKKAKTAGIKATNGGGWSSLNRIASAV